MWNKEDKSFKALINKRTTSSGKGHYEEESDATINTNITEIWQESIPSNPEDAIAIRPEVVVTPLDNPDSLVWGAQAYGDGVLVQCCTFNITTQLLYSTRYSLDYGKNWIDVNISRVGFTSPFIPKSACYCGDGIFLIGKTLPAAPQQDPRVIRSSDYGRTWTPITVGSPLRAFTKMYYANGVVLAGSGGTIAHYGLSYSLDKGLTWVNSTSFPSDYQPWSIIFANGVFMIHAYKGQYEMRIITSPDGITWTTVKTFTLWNERWPGPMLYNKGAWVTFTETGIDNGGRRIRRSTDNGVTWSVIVDAATSLGGGSHGILVDDTMIFYVDTGYAYVSSDTGITWKLYNVSPAIAMQSIIRDPNLKMSFGLSTDTVKSLVTMKDPVGVARLYDLFTMTEDTSVGNQQSYYAYDGISRVKDWIGPKYGSGYQVKLYDNNNNQIFATDPCGWIFDYCTGVLDFSGSTAGFAKPFKITGYKYIAGNVEVGPYVKRQASYPGVSQPGSVNIDGTIRSSKLLVGQYTDYNMDTTKPPMVRFGSDFGRAILTLYSKTYQTLANYNPIIQFDASRLDGVKYSAASIWSSKNTNVGSENNYTSLLHFAVSSATDDGFTQNGMISSRLLSPGGKIISIDWNGALIVGRYHYGSGITPFVASLYQLECNGNLGIIAGKIFLGSVALLATPSPNFIENDGASLYFTNAASERTKIAQQISKTISIASANGQYVFTFVTEGFADFLDTSYKISLCGIGSNSVKCWPCVSSNKATTGFTISLMASPGVAYDAVANGAVTVDVLIIRS